jgi:hypothetical protein
MTEDDFRRIALSMPEASEGSHMENADFRVKGKVFASLWPDGESGMVKLTPDQQAKFVTADPAAFSPVKGGWGERGATQVHLGAADAGTLRRALTAAWRNTAPKRLVEEHDPAGEE